MLDAGPPRSAWITGVATCTIVESSRFIASATNNVASAAQRQRYGARVTVRPPLPRGPPRVREARHPVDVHEPDLTYIWIPLVPLILVKYSAGSVRMKDSHVL